MGLTPLVRSSERMGVMNQKKGIAMRLVPVVAFSSVFVFAAIKPPEPSWGVPLLGVLVILMILSFKAWTRSSQDHRK